MRLDVRVISDFAELAAREGEWRALLEASAQNRPTLTPEWLATWWQVFGSRDGRRLRSLLVLDGQRLVGLAPLCRRDHGYAPGLSFRRIELLGSGEDERDEICSDYIGIIALSGRELEIADAVAGALAEGACGEWDEVVMPAMNGEDLVPWALADALARRGTPAQTELTAPSPHIPLPESWDAYLEALSASRRRMLLRTLRDFDRWAKGRERFVVARTDAELRAGFSILTELHRERWRANGESGVFESEAFKSFHESALPLLHGRGALELCWLEHDGRPLAALYNLVQGERVLFYQSGRTTDLPSSVRAGHVLHAHAIRRAIELGRREYDFLPGPSRYKLGFALATRPMVTLRAARPGLRETLRLVGAQAAAVARRSQLLRPNGAETPEPGGHSRLATDLARSIVRRLRSSTTAMENSHEAS